MLDRRPLQDITRSIKIARILDPRHSSFSLVSTGVARSTVVGLATPQFMPDT